jgi:hypothetical protein
MHFGFTPYGAEPWHWEFNPPTLDPNAPQPPIPSVAINGFGHYSEFGEQPAPAPAADPLDLFSTSERKALRLTSYWEGARMLPFNALAGNFDGQGLSFGMLQWNIGTGSLQPMLKQFDARFPERFNQIFGRDAEALRGILRQRRADQLAWAVGINDANKRIIQPWAGYFRALGADPEFQQIQTRSARRLMNCAIKSAEHFRLPSERALAFMFDTVSQAGPAWLSVKDRQRLIDEGIARVAQMVAGPLSPRQVLQVIANVLASTSAAKFQNDVRRRKTAIASGQGFVHGENINVDQRFAITDQPHDGTVVPIPGLRGNC